MTLEKPVKQIKIIQGKNLEKLEQNVNEWLIENNSFIKIIAANLIHNYVNDRECLIVYQTHKDELIAIQNRQNVSKVNEE